MILIQFFGHKSYNFNTPSEIPFLIKMFTFTYFISLVFKLWQNQMWPILLYTQSRKYKSIGKKHFTYFVLQLSMPIGALVLKKGSVDVIKFTLWYFLSRSQTY